MLSGLFDLLFGWDFVLHIILYSNNKTIFFFLQHGDQ